MSDSNCVCMIPWVHRFTSEQGNHQICCVGIGDSNTIRDAAGRPLHISQQLTDAEVLNSPDLKAVRAGMLRGEWPAACRRCREAEEAGSSSGRQAYNQRFDRWRAEALAQTLDDGTLVNPAVRYADIRLGNMCNLTCRMCGPYASRPWVDHYNEVQPPERVLPEAGLLAMRESWVKRQPVRWLLEQCLPTLESLHFAGGEPMMIPEMVEALQYCIDSGRAGEIDLSYNTNITLLPEKVTRLWPKFRGVSLVVSIDGVGQVNEYIRRPSRWRDIDRNMRLLEQNFDQWQLRSVVVNMTVQVYNVLEVGDLFDYLSGNFTRIEPIPQLTPVMDPEYLSIQILPDRIKAAARRHLEAIRERTRSFARPYGYHLTGTFNTTLAHLDGGAGSPKQFADFLYFSQRSDRRFGDSWRSACPRLAAMLNGA